MQLSIIIATKNREDILLKSILHALEAIQNFEAEIIIINDGDPIGKLIEHEKLLLLDNHQRGVSKARNLGAEKAKSSLLFFIDDDMWITKESISEILDLEKTAFFNNSCVCLNWEYPEILVQQLKYSKIGRYLLEGRYHTMEGRMHKHIDYSISLQETNSIGSGAFIIYKKIFNVAGGYNENIGFQGEDLDLSKRLISNKVIMKILTKITAFHNQQDRLDIDGFLDRIYRGYTSQIKAGMPMNFPPIKSLIYQSLLHFYGLLKFSFKLTPNIPIWDILSFRLIGILSSLSYFRALKHSNTPHAREKN